jgi:hypothetical protein
MYTYQIIVHGCKNVKIPEKIVSQFEKKMYPKITKELQKSGYDPGNYIIVLPYKMWKLSTDIHKGVNTYHVYKKRRVSVVGSIYRKVYPPGKENSKAILVISGSVSFYWDISKNCTDQEIKDLIIDDDLTQLLVSPLCRINILDLNTVPLLYKQDNKPHPKQCSSNKSIRVPYEIIGEDYPDAIFCIYFARKITENQLKILDDFFQDYMCRNNNLNQGNDEKIIDYIGDAQSSDSDKRIAEIHIDFGNCDPEVISELLAELSEKVTGIKKIIVL